MDHTSAVRQALIRYSEDSYSLPSSNLRPPSDKTFVYSYNDHDPPASLERSETKQELIARLYPNETRAENPPLQDGATTFAACMLVMDDNHRLTEWMAYHYHVLPLRYMIVAVDPRSKTSPTHILNQWRARGVHILEWGDRDFWRADLKLVPIPDDAELQTKRDRHRGRQKYFYKQCLIRCKNDNRTWVSLHDSDEYLVYNHAGGDKFEEWEKRRSANSRMPRMKPSMTPPTTAEAGAMIKYINHERDAGLKYYQSPCIGVPRTMFGADESQVDEKAIVRSVPKPFHWAAPLMDSLKYRQHATRNDFVKNALGKVIIDVSRVNVAKTPYFMSLHRPIKKICPTPWINDWNSGLRINHYLGSWNSYSFRDDSRRGNERSWEVWTYKATTLGENTDDNIRPWLSGLIQQEGADVAAEMLKDVGLPANYKNGDDYRWHLLPERLNEILSTDVTIKQDNKVVAFEDWVRQTYRKYPEMVKDRERDYERVKAERAANNDVADEEEEEEEDGDDKAQEEIEGEAAESEEGIVQAPDGDGMEHDQEVVNDDTQEDPDVGGVGHDGGDSELEEGSAMEGIQDDDEKEEDEPLEADKDKDDSVLVALDVENSEAIVQ